MKNTYGGVLLLVKLPLKLATLLKVTLLHGCSSRFIHCTNDTKLRNASQRIMGLQKKFYYVIISSFEVFNMKHFKLEIYSFPSWDYN